jgi:hypothetical protein
LEVEMMKNKVDTVPPVTVFKVPVRMGSRGYGCKIENKHLVIPYNPAVVIHFPELVANLNKFEMNRKDFNALPDY